MLKHLSISNYVLIRELEMDFPAGLNIITGETGAGKSIMLGALSLLMGKKADISVLSDTSRNCVVEGEFDVDGNCIILRRLITPSGRSRAFVNDEPVQVSELVELSSTLIDIHEQHQSRLLDSPDYQLKVLDGFCGNQTMLEEYDSMWRMLQNRRKESELLKSSIQSAALDRDYRQFQFDQLDSASLKNGELEELEEEHRVLSNAEMIKGELLHTSASMENEEYSTLRILKDAVTALSKVEKCLPRAAELSRRLDEARIEIEDITSEIDSMCERINVSPQRLSEVEERMDIIYSLLKKHNVTTVQELTELRDTLGQLLEKSDNDSFRLIEMEKEISLLEHEVEEKASELSQRRQRAAANFSAELQNCIRTLEMPDAVFEVSVSAKGVCGPSGSDDVKFLFSANAGSPEGELFKVASGGELSRVILSLKKVISEYTTLPTMIFDEIDTGVSGRIADRMGRMISEMGNRMQIFAITHLPQIACQDGTHFLIEKHTEGAIACTVIHHLSDTDRVAEIARMLSGDSVSEAAFENARTLLKVNKYNKINN